MEQFIETHIALVNKNSPIVISYGKSLNEAIFNSRLNKTTIQRIIHNIQSDKSIKQSVQHLNDCTDYKYNNQIITKYNNEIEYNIIHNNYTYTDDNIIIQVLEIYKDTYICPSIPVTHSICNYDIMKLNVYNGCDIIIYDCKSYFKVDIKINKPMPVPILNQIINHIKY